MTTLVRRDEQRIAFLWSKCRLSGDKECSLVKLCVAMSRKEVACGLCRSDGSLMELKNTRADRYFQPEISNSFLAALWTKALFFVVRNDTAKDADGRHLLARVFIMRFIWALCRDDHQTWHIDSGSASVSLLWILKACFSESRGGSGALESQATLGLATKGLFHRVSTFRYHTSQRCCVSVWREKNFSSTPILDRYVVFIVKTV